MVWEESRDYYRLEAFLKKCSYRYIMITGGEPGVREDIEDIINICCKYRDNVRLFTNSTFALKHEYYLQNSRIELQVSIPKNGYVNDYVRVPNILANYAGRKTGFYNIDKDFMECSSILEQYRESFDYIFCQPLVAPKESAVHENTLSACTKPLRDRILRKAKTISNRNEAFYSYLVNYYDNPSFYQNRCCLVPCRSTTLNPDFTFSKCMHSTYHSASDWAEGGANCFTERCLCMASFRE